MFFSFTFNIFLVFSCWWVNLRWGLQVSSISTPRRMAEAWLMCSFSAWTSMKPFRGCCWKVTVWFAVVAGQNDSCKILFHLPLGTENADTGQKERGCHSAFVDPSPVNCFEQGLKGRMWKRDLYQKKVCIQLLVSKSAPEDHLHLFDGTSCKRNIDVVMCVCVHVFVLQLEQF